MGFSNCGFAMATVLLLCSATVAQRGGPTITVLVNNSSDLEPPILRNAELETAKVFAAAGIAIDWVSCSETDACRHPLAPGEFVLHIVRTGRTQADSVFGEAFLGEDGTGKYCDVFFDRLRREKDVEIARLLGAVSAHELAHLLLGSHSHSPMGIMEPVWEQEGLRKLGMGNLMFTKEEARSMRDRISRYSTAAGSGSPASR
jgi:hypothetical protein